GGRQPSRTGRLPAVPLDGVPLNGVPLDGDTAPPAVTADQRDEHEADGQWEEAFPVPPQPQWIDPQDLPLNPRDDRAEVDPFLPDFEDEVFEPVPPPTPVDPEFDGSY